MGADHRCRLPTWNFGLMAVLWPVVAWGADQEPAWMVRAPEIKFENRASYAETSLQQSVAGAFGYSLGLKVTPERRSEVYGGPIMRPLKGLEIGLERSWERSVGSHNESWMPGDPPRLGAQFDHRGSDERPKLLPVNLGSTGPLQYELYGSRLRVKYYIDEHTVVSMRARYNRVEQKATVWLWFERRF